MAICYNDAIAGWSHNSNAGEVLEGNNCLVYKKWYIDLMLKWHRQDKVSDKEILRNNAAYDIQHNRNPYIDHPELAEYVWGDQMGNLWYEQGATSPAIGSPANGSVIDFGTTSVGMPLVKNVYVKGVLLTQDLTVTVTGEGFSCSTSTITAAQAVAGTTISITFSNDEVKTATGKLSIAGSEAATEVTLRATSSLVALHTPVATPATQLTATSFQANWNGVNGAESYTLYVNAKGAEPQPGEMLLDEDMSNGATTWTTEGKTYNESDCLRLGTAGGTGSVISPALNLASSNGKVTVKTVAKYYGNDKGAKMKVSVVNAGGDVLDSKTFEVAGSNAEYVAVLTGNASADNRIKIENVVNKKRILLKGIKVYAGEAGVNAPAHKSTETGDATKRVITGITATGYVVSDLTENGAFEYYVKAVRGNEETAASNVIEVKLRNIVQLQGDVNQDEKVDMNDVATLINKILDTENYADNLCDIDNDGKIDVSDVTALINLILNN